MNEILTQIENTGIVPVVVLDDPKDAEPLAEALCSGGLPCAEVTFRTPAAAQSIRIMSEKFPHMLIGAGTVLTTEQVDSAVDRIVKYCTERNIVITPGCANPSDVEQAIENGLDVVKFFPAEQAGGLAYIKAIAAPYAGIKFMPTGGINPKNVRDYLAYDRILACGGSWMVKGDLIRDGKFDEIRELVKEAVNIVKESRGK